MDYSPGDKTINEYCNNFSKIVSNMVINSSFIPGALEFIKKNYKNFSQYIVSATPQKELTFIVNSLGISNFFLNIYGSPIDKEAHIKSIILENKNSLFDFIYIGDSLSDMKCSKKVGIDFIGLKNELVTFPDEIKTISNLFELETMVKKI